MYLLGKKNVFLAENYSLARFKTAAFLLHFGLGLLVKVCYLRYVLMRSICMILSCCVPYHGAMPVKKKQKKNHQSKLNRERHLSKKHFL